MSIYLAWSAYKLIGVTLVATSALYLGLRQLDKKEAAKSADPRDKLLTWWNKTALYFLVLCFILLSAVNIGQPQSNLGRSNFNANVPTETISKKSVDTLDSDKVQSQFKLKLQEKQNVESN